ncbi:cytochrome b [Amphritea sp. 2_MG-2023]|uniref:cytochrome b n=1 Tax=Amphritea TaxID=515417 RepID=UPI001C078A2C|nr:MULTISPECIES: cytochrome b [Amphritea]MBU2967356.1 cytochrome b [Amphritea atlantica]MDO6418389.1 cytochrome b [Amphritea sp. 2_MG-2023]
MDSRAQLTKTTVFLHWIIALAIIGSLGFGLYLEDLPGSPDKGALIGIHKSIGVLILVVALYRIYWRIRNGFPQRLTPVADWQEKAATLVHLILLAGTVLMPISGIFMSVGGGHSVAVFGLEVIPAQGEIEWMGDLGHLLHGLGGKIMIAAILLHVAAAVKLWLFTKDSTMQRMLGRKVS